MEGLVDGVEALVTTQTEHCGPSHGTVPTISRRAGITDPVHLVYGADKGLYVLLVRSVHNGLSRLATMY